MATTALIQHSSQVKHKISEFHPECPQRLVAIENSLIENGLYDSLLRRQARDACREELVSVHEPHYVDWIFAHAPSGEAAPLQIDGDTAMNGHSLSAALTAAGGVLDAVDGVMNQAFDNAFCLVRPPGHHAEAATAMGFCFFDNVAVGAQYLLDQYDIERVAIVDFDVHHGNGTEAIFRGKKNILFCSTFQEHIFPGKYAPSEPGHLLNVPLASGTDGEAYRRIFSETVLPELEKFKPEFVFFSAGFDAHRNDPLANLNLEADDFFWITESVMQIADIHARSRVVSTLEGGYDLEGLALSASAHVNALMQNV